jgi:hypothetical protein
MEPPIFTFVIASQRVGAKRRPMTGTAKQSSFLSCCSMDCFAALAMTSLEHFESSAEYPLDDTDASATIEL